jgi:uncharacterized protein Yka (UPF0111/DUF47 family)
MDIDIQELEFKKRFLKRYKKNLALIERLNEKVDNLTNRIESIKSPIISDMPRGGVPVTKEDLIADKLETEERIERLKIKGKKYKGEILDIIDELDDTRYADILESFFIDCESLDNIADNMGYTLRHVIRLYSEAIISIDLECQ